MAKLEELIKAKDNAYWERNQLVAALSKIFPAHLAKHPESDTEWEADWRTIVVVYLPHAATSLGSKIRDSRLSFITIGKSEPLIQMTWHIHDSEVSMFDHLCDLVALERAMTGKSYSQNMFNWDGHTTEEKYRRLRLLRPADLLLQDEEE